MTLFASVSMEIEALFFEGHMSCESEALHNI